jgi:hypothetical protein
MADLKFPYDYLRQNKEGGGWGVEFDLCLPKITFIIYRIVLRTVRDCKIKLFSSVPLRTASILQFVWYLGSCLYTR